MILLTYLIVRDTTLLGLLQLGPLFSPNLIPDNVDLAVGDQDQPTLTECVILQGLKRRICLPLEIGTKYNMFGILLLEDRTGERVSAIAEKHKNDAEKTIVNILEEWIAGRGKHPVTWKTLTETLCDTGLNVLAEEIEAVKLQTAHSKAQSSELDLLQYRILFVRHNSKSRHSVLASCILHCTQQSF